MPSGLVHTRTSIVLSAVVPILLDVPLPDRIAFAVGSLLGIIISPDLDVDIGFYGLYVIRRYAGRFPAWLWRIYWLPYSKLVPHRAFFSHFPLFSTAGRILYLCVPFLCLLALFGANLGIVFSFLVDIRWLLAGLVVSDAVHAVMDVTQTAFRRKF
jgi:uncharacterized metal-binding protein